MDVLKRFQLDLDWDRGSITILRPPKHLVTDHARLVQMRHLENGLPVISASANGKPEWEFFVDTGFSGAIMLPAIDEDVVVKDGLQPRVASKTLTIFGEDKNVRMRLNELKAGNIRFGNIICTISTTCEKRIVGIGLFRHYRTIMNFPAAEIEFIPRKSVQQDEADMSGVKLLRIDGKVVVVFIDREMPGAEAGVLEGDEIIELNGKPVRDASPQSLRALLHEGDGKKVSLGILRNGVEKKIEFVLRRQI